jgi:CBS-domain-containing membrane protein
MGAALMWFLSYLGANFALILVVVMLVVALGAIAWFAKNWKVAVAAILLVCAGLGYQQIDKNAYQRRVSEEAAQQVKVLQDRLTTLQDVSKADAERALAANAIITELERTASMTPANDGPCLDAGAAARVGDIK